MRLRIPTSAFWLWLLVALQVAIPASYYLVRENSDNERFAWRMFSAVRLKRCDVLAFDGEGERLRPIDLSRALHASWQRTLERGRRGAISEFLARRCREPATGFALLRRRCVSPAARKLPTEVYRFDCASSTLELTP